MLTYEFYKEEYFGSTVSLEDFQKWLQRAEDELQYICNGNITEEAQEAFGTQIKKAICALMDMLYVIDKAQNTASSGVKSRTSGDESITYGLEDSAIQKAISSTQYRESLLFDTVRRYLFNTGLLYQGV